MVRHEIHYIDTGGISGYIDLPEGVNYPGDEFYGHRAVPIEITPIVSESEKYQQRIIDGIAAHLTLMSELKIYSEQNGLPRIVNQTIEDAFDGVIKQLYRGQWGTAREKLDLVTVGGFITQEFWDRVKVGIDTYCLQSYGKYYGSSIQ